MKKLPFSVVTIFATTTSLMAGLWDWIKIIGDVLLLLFSGSDVNHAVHNASMKYNVPSCEIWQHGGFGHEDKMPKRCNKLRYVDPPTAR